MEPKPLAIPTPVQRPNSLVPIQPTTKPIPLINAFVPKPKPIAEQDGIQQTTRRVALLPSVARSGSHISLLKSLNELQKQYGKA